MTSPTHFVYVAGVGYEPRSRLMATLSGTRHSQEPFVHLYDADPHTIVEACGPRFEFPWQASVV